MQTRRRPTRIRFAHGLAAALLVVGCFEGDFVQGLPCSQDADCGPALTCVEDLCGGLGDAALCGNGLLEHGELCDDGNALDGDGCTPACQLPACGDGFVAMDELCDDGNTLDGDGCPASCSLCGNGILEVSETCDDGNVEASDNCTPVCRVPVCGDSFLAPGEACDDGNQNGTDDCTPTCTLPACGDGFVNVEGEVCDDGNAIETDACTSACTESPQPPTLELQLAQVKQFEFSWSSLGAAFFRLFERAEAEAPWVQIGGELVGESFTHTVPLHFRSSASYQLEACNADGSVCRSSEVVPVVGNLGEAVGYFKASNPDFFDRFGERLVLSGDGNTLAVAATAEDGGAPGVNAPHEDDNSSPQSGAVYVFVREGGTWVQQAYIKAHNTGENDSFGAALALSDDGNTLAVGAPLESSNATGIDGDPYNNGVHESGAVYVYTREQGTWSQQAYVKADNTGLLRRFGWNVSLSDDGDTLATLQGPVDLPAPNHQPGNVFVFVREGGTWSQQQRISNVWAAYPTYDWRGNVVLSGDGESLAIGEPFYSGQYGSPGAVTMYAREGQQWSLASTIDSPTERDESFGAELALSDDGTTLVVTAKWDTSAATGIDGDQLADTAMHVGGAFVYTLDAGSWSQQAYLKASNAAALAEFGSSAALSANGDILAIGAVHESSGATGVDGDPFAEPNESRGAVYVFVREGGAWSQRSYIKAPYHARAFGSDVSLSDSGDSLAVGASDEDFDGSGVGGVPDPDELLPSSGAAYLY